MQKKQRTERSKSKDTAKNKKKSFLEKYQWSGPLILAALSVILFLPVFSQPYLNGDDAAQHYWWSKEFIHEISQGTLYPHWLSRAFEGRGSPILFYYPPVPFYVTSFFYIFVRDPLLSLYWGCCLGLLISGITMYFYSKTFLSQRDSFWAAAVYMTAHYHLFDFYQRMAQHEFWAFAWIPLIFYGINRLNKEDHWRAGLYVAAGYALLLMTHLPTALMITFLLPVYLLILTRNIRKIAYVGASLVLGVGLSAIFLFGFLFGRGYLKPLGARAANQSYRAGFLFENLGEAIKQIPLPSNSNFDQFLLAGDWMAVGFLVLLVVCTVVLWNSEFKQNSVIRGLWVITIFSLLMGTRLTMPIWQFLPQVRNIQFPIRWFTIVSLGASLLVAIAVSVAIRNLRSPYLSATMLTLVILLNLVISWLIISRAPFQADVFQKRISVYTDVREYHPMWWDEKPHKDLEAAPAVVVDGKATVTPVDAEGIVQNYSISVVEDALVKFRTLYFPGWQAQIDGQAVTVSPNDAGDIQIAFTQGEHLLTLQLKDTPVQTRGEIVSGLSLLAFLALCFIPRRKTTEPQNLEDPPVLIEEMPETRNKRKQTEK